MSWTIQYKASDLSATVYEYTLAQWGVDALVIEERDGQAGTMKFSIPVSRAVDGQLFKHKGLIRLNKDGARFWEGRLSDPLTTIQPGTERLDYLARDPWYYFDEVAAHQTWRTADLDDVERSRLLFFGLYDAGSSSVVLKTVGYEITKLIEQLIADITPALSVFDHALPAPGTIDDGASPVPQKVEHLSFSEAIRKCAHYDPDRVTWWDYSGVAGPIIHSRLAPALPVVSVPIQAKGFHVSRVREGATPAVIVTLHIQDASAGLPARTGYLQSMYPSDYSGSLLGVLRIDLDQNAYYGPTQAAALAQAIHDQSQAIAWRGAYTMKEAECTRTLDLGRRLSVTGADPAWAGMNAPIRHVTRDIIKGQTTAEFGPPAMLSAHDLQELLMPHWAKIKAAIEELRERDTGRSNESCGGGGRKEKEEPGFPPMGWQPLDTLIYDSGLSKARDATLIEKFVPGAPHTYDPVKVYCIEAASGTFEVKILNAPFDALTAP